MIVDALAVVSENDVAAVLFVDKLGPTKDVLIMIRK
jgi:hypothetical protein